MATSDRLKIRSFISLPISEQARGILRKTINEIDGVIQNKIRWVRPEGIHLTLKFMGDIKTDKIDALLLLLPEIATEVTPFELTLSELGCFPNNRRPRVLWAGVKGDLSILQNLHLAVDNVVEQVGLPRERRGFSPHLTLGRVRRNISEREVDQIGQIIGSTSLPNTPSWTNQTIDLMRTELDPGGSRHYLVGSFPMLS